jgi:hypothetical protein
MGAAGGCPHLHALIFLNFFQTYPGISDGKKAT